MLYIMPLVSAFMAPPSLPSQYGSSMSMSGLLQHNLWLSFQGLKSSFDLLLEVACPW